MHAETVDAVRSESGATAASAERAEAARRFIERCGYAAAALALIPIPVSEAVAVVPLHVGMVTGVAQIYGKDITRDSASELTLKIATTAGLSLVGSRIATAATKLLLPGLGGLLAAPLMYASTIAIGAVARAYFESDGRLSDAAMKGIYSDWMKKARETFDPTRARAADAAVPAPGESKPDPVARLTKLAELKEKGLVGAEEYDETKKRILSEI